MNFFFIFERLPLRSIISPHTGHLCALGDAPSAPRTCAVSPGAAATQVNDGVLGRPLLLTLAHGRRVLRAPRGRRGRGPRRRRRGPRRLHTGSRRAVAGRGPDVWRSRESGDIGPCVR